MQDLYYNGSLEGAAQLRAALNPSCMYQQLELTAACSCNCMNSKQPLAEQLVRPAIPSFLHSTNHSPRPRPLSFLAKLSMTPIRSDIRAYDIFGYTCSHPVILYSKMSLQACQ
jgi:hypothetical protein